MPKAGKKRKKAEKSKTKLRQSIKLPKGLNETNAEVKSKTIKVLNQLRTQDGDEDRLSKKKIGVRDLMSKLSNNGTATKLEGIEGLSELVKAYPEICQEQLSQLLSSVIPIHTHIESKLRVATRSLINFILSHVDVSQVLPLSTLITAHLCCGLSHIDSDLQRDSLKLLDIIIDCSPIVVIRGHDQILPNCLDQVSLNAKSNNQIQQRSLNKNVSSKVSALQWRTQVLQRALKIVSIVQGKIETNSNSEPACGRKSFEEFNMNLLVASSVSSQKSMSLQEITNSRHLDKKDRSNTPEFNLNVFMKQVNDLLFQTWCEAIAIDKKTQDQNMISYTVLPTLTVIVDLLLASESDLDGKLLGYIMNSFPLELLPVTSNNVLAEKSNEKYSINGLNLDICLLVMRQNDCEHIPQVFDYIKGFQVEDVTEASKLGMILSLVVTNDVQQNIESVDSVVGQLATIHRNNECVVKALISMSTWAARGQLPNVERWINELPNLLVSPRANLGHIEAIKILFKRRDAVLLEAFKSFDSFPAEFPVKDSTVLDQVFRMLAVCPIGISNEDLIYQMKDTTVSKNTRNFVNNMFNDMDF